MVHIFLLHQICQGLTYLKYFVEFNVTVDDDDDDNDDDDNDDDDWWLATDDDDDGGDGDDDDDDTWTCPSYNMQHIVSCDTTSTVSCHVIRSI